MRLRNLFFISMAVFLTESALAKDVPQSPDPEFLEFLGTFEAEGEKNIDPLDLADLSGDGKVAAQPTQKFSAEDKEKKEGKGIRR